MRASRTLASVTVLVSVLAAAVHAPIGLRTILLETTPLPPRVAEALGGVLLITILVAGLRAVFGLYGFSG